MNAYFGDDLNKTSGIFHINKTKFKLKQIADFLCNEAPEQEHELKPAIVQKYLPAIDVVRRDSNTSNCFTGAYANYFTGTGSFILLNEDILPDRLAELKKSDCDRSEVRLRKFRPREIANLMGFPGSFQLPDHLTLKQAYKLLGNSVNVRVISYLFKILLSNETPTKSNVQN